MEHMSHQHDDSPPDPPDRGLHGDDTPGPSSKRLRQRTHGSCTQCRKRKLRCDRVLPCSSCSSRGEQDLCNYGSGAPLQVNRVSSDTLELRKQIDRLRELVQTLSQSSASASGTANVSHSRTASPHHKSSLNPVTSSKPPDSISRSDTWLALSQLIIVHLGVLYMSPSSSVPFLQEAIVFLSESFDAPEQVFLPTFPFTVTALPTIETLASSMPTGPILHACISHYILTCEWHYHFLHIPSFNEQIARLSQSPFSSQDPTFMAVILVASGIGLAIMNDSQAAQSGCPTGAGKFELAHRWMESATHALNLSNFLQTPSFNAIRALAMLATYFSCIGNGDSLRAGVAAVSLATCCLNILNAHTEPSPQLSQLERQDRRRLFWCLFLLDRNINSALGRTSSFPTVGTIEVALPGNYDDSDFDANGEIDFNSVDTSLNRETVMTSIIFDIHCGILSKRFDERLHGKALDLDFMLDLDWELSKLISEIPHYFLLEWHDTSILAMPSAVSRLTLIRLFSININIIGLRFDINRHILLANGPQAPNATIVCRRSARMILAIHRHPYTSRFGIGMSFHAVVAGVFLALDLLDRGAGSSTNLIIGEIIATANILEGGPTASSVTRKGSKLLRLLLSKTQGSPVLKDINNFNPANVMLPGPSLFVKDGDRSEITPKVSRSRSYDQMVSSKSPETRQGSRRRGSLLERQRTMITQGECVSQSSSSVGFGSFSQAGSEHNYGAASTTPPFQAHFPQISQHGFPPAPPTALQSPVPSVEQTIPSHMVSDTASMQPTGGQSVPVSGPIHFYPNPFHQPFINQEMRGNVQGQTVPEIPVTHVSNASSLQSSLSSSGSQGQQRESGLPSTYYYDVSPKSQGDE